MSFYQLYQPVHTHTHGSLGTTDLVTIDFFFPPVIKASTLTRVSDITRTHAHEATHTYTPVSQKVGSEFYSGLCFDKDSQRVAFVCASGKGSNFNFSTNY